MPNFPENTGFKLPGMGSKEIDTPGNFRKDQGVEDVGYCSTTESHMLPKGSSPLLKTSMIEHVVPEYYKTSYTKTNWPTKRKSKKGGGEDQKVTANINTPEYTPPEIKGDLTVPDLTGKGGDSGVPNLVELGREGKKTDKVRYTDLPEEQRAAARKWNLAQHGTHQTTELAKSTGGRKGLDTSFDYTGDRDKAMREKRKQLGY